VLATRQAARASSVISRSWRTAPSLWSPSAGYPAPGVSRVAATAPPARTGSSPPATRPRPNASRQVHHPPQVGRRRPHAHPRRRLGTRGRSLTDGAGPDVSTRSRPPFRRPGCGPRRIRDRRAIDDEAG